MERGEKKRSSQRGRRPSQRARRGARRGKINDGDLRHPRSRTAALAGKKAVRACVLLLGGARRRGGVDGHVGRGCGGQWPRLRRAAGSGCFRWPRGRESREGGPERGRKRLLLVAESRRPEHVPHELAQGLVGCGDVDGGGGCSSSCRQSLDRGERMQGCGLVGVVAKEQRLQAERPLRRGNGVGSIVGKSVGRTERGTSVHGKK